MGLYDEVVEVPRRTMVLFFVVDTSGSMSGAKIGTVNSAIEEVVPELKDISECNADAQIKVATLSFSTGAQWIDSEPVAAENYRWNYLDANGVTDLGEACNKLNEKLSRNAFMSDATGAFAPAIFLLSDGEPTDNYKHGLEKLKQNNWFKKAIKVAVAIGDDANQTVLADFTGNVEAVITVHTPEALKKWIQFVSVRASEIGSKSSNAGNSPVDTGNSSNGDISGTDEIASKQDEFVQEIQAQAADAADWDSFDDDGIQW
jgi:uncharacterized protein YegL